MRKFPIFFQKTSENADMAASTGIIYEFADFRLVPDDDLLLRLDEPVPLTPKAFSTLVMLVEQHGHLVRKEELIERVWADSNVEESAVSRCVWTIRNALGEASKDHRFIQTIPKRGYKFIGQVSTRPIDQRTNGHTLGPIPDQGVNFDTNGRRGERFFGPRLALYVGLTLVFVVATVGWYLGSEATPAVAIGAPSSLAILPLKPIDSQNSSEIHEIGVAETLIHRLSGSRSLIVRPLSSVRKYAGIEEDALKAGREQKVGYVLASNYQIADGKVRITAQLIDVPSGGVQDTYKIETSASDIFELQDAVADEIAKKLLARFENEPSKYQITRGTENEEAYRLYLQGKSLTMRRNPVDAAKARDYLERAINLDPNFALAYAQLARVTRRSDIAGEQSQDRAGQLIEKALELDPNLTDAYVARAEKTLLHDWDFPAIERDLKKALEIEPNNDQAHWLSAMISVQRGQFDDALMKIDIARSIDPSAVMYMFHRGRILYYARRYDEAITQYRQASDLDDRFMQPYGWLARVYEVTGDEKAAFEHFIRGEERSPRKENIDIYRKLYEDKGWMGFRSSVEELKPRELIFFDLARIRALHGEKDAAFAALEKAVEDREWLMVTLNIEPAFDSLREDTRFADLNRRVNFERN